MGSEPWLGSHQELGVGNLTLKISRELWVPRESSADV